MKRWLVCLTLVTVACSGSTKEASSPKVATTAPDPVAQLCADLLPLQVLIVAKDQQVGAPSEEQTREWQDSLRSSSVALGTDVDGLATAGEADLAAETQVLADATGKWADTWAKAVTKPNVRSFIVFLHSENKALKTYNDLYASLDNCSA